VTDQKRSLEPEATVLHHLRELVQALEHRVPHIEREGEAQIARDAAALKEAALRRIGELERKR
jgi:hypothetical protein